MTELQDEARAELDELKRDAARFQHLVNSVKCISVYMDGNHAWGFHFGKGWKVGATFREAVDKAMRDDL